MVRDPVCGMNINREMAAGSLRREGRTYYFCSKGCLQEFRSWPGRFLKAGVPSGPNEETP
ncbi:MAG: hypothetical protein A2Z17_04070 [Gammaproteobacteria bacterium RBG_16_66_13]|nr:MAG: hypothetical protein A2Z17_04070 [Gammaproteobacteria bacterium RBG_16_66_13]